VEDVSATPLVSFTKEENVESAETCKRYEVAPLEAFQLSVGVRDTSVAPLAGATNVGAAGAGGGSAVNDHRADQALVPPAFLAFTRQ
jgi:hypothetical protein